LKAAEPTGFSYRLSDEVLEAYQAKPLALRLKWLYMGNLLRKALPARTRKLHDEFRAKNIDTNAFSNVR
jgi:hypothetical protein